MCSPKNLWNNICLLLHVPVGTFWWFLNVFAMFDMFFEKVFSYFYDWIKQKAGNKLYPPTENNKAMETLQTKQT